MPSSEQRLTSQTEAPGKVLNGQPENAGWSPEALDARPFEEGKREPGE